MMMNDLIEGARAAREASVDGMVVELVITEEGIIARGERIHAGVTKRGAAEVSWRDLDARIAPNLIANAVALVSIGLRS